MTVSTETSTRATSPTLALTFDNGPDPIVTPAVLEILRQRHLPATFFPLGRHLEEPAHRGLMQRAAGEGHRIGNHTYSHPRPFGVLSPAQAIDEIERTDALLGDLCLPDRMFRPSAGGGVKRPGVLKQETVDYLIKTKRTLVLWNVICEDWCRGDGSWVEIALKEIAKHEKSLIVLHDIPSGAMDHLPTFIDRVHAAGVEIVADLPPEEVPILRGELVGSVDNIV